MAGRITPGSTDRASTLPMAITAPVLPAETHGIDVAVFMHLHGDCDGGVFFVKPSVAGMCMSTTSEA